MPVPKKWTVYCFRGPVSFASEYKKTPALVRYKKIEGREGKKGPG